MISSSSAGSVGVVSVEPPELVVRVVVPVVVRVVV